MAWGEPVFVHTSEENHFVPQLSDIEKAITPKTKAIIVNSPSNPNGCVYPTEVLEGIARLAVEHGFYVISDEIYEKLIYDGEQHVSIAQLSDAIKEQTIIVNGVSKSFAMTGWRIGYTASPAHIAKAMTSFQSHATSNANSIAQHAASVALADSGEVMHEMVAEFSARRVLLTESINDIPGLSANLPKGAFYVMVNISALIGKKHGDTVIDGSSAFAEELINSKQVAVVPGLAFGTDNHVRLSYAVSRANIMEGMRRLREFVNELV